MTNESHVNPLQHFRFPIGVDCIFEGILNSTAGFEMVLASRAEPIPNLQQSIERYQSELDEAAIHLHVTDDDTTTAGLIRASIRAARSAIALFDVRGFRRAFDTLYEVTKMNTPAGVPAVIVACESRWRELLEPTANPVRHLDLLTPLDANASKRNSEQQHHVPADLRELAHYLGLPILAPASPPEVSAYINEAALLSQAARQPILVYLSPALIGGGETNWDTPDSELRPIPVSKLERHGPTIPHALLDEARARSIDRVLNAPVSGEVAPLGFVTFGTAHTALRHALSILGLKGRIPILKLGLANPIDRHSAHQFLTRCRDVVVIENGEPIIETQLLAINQALNQKGISTPRILGDRLHLDVNQPHQATPLTSAAGVPLTGIPHDVELNPTELVQIITEILRTRFIKPISAETARPLDQRQLFKTSKLIRTRRTPNPSPTTINLFLPVIKTALEELTEQLAIPEPNRAPISIRIENAETTSFETSENERVVVLIQRRRLVNVGRSVIAHAIQRNLPITFLVLPRNRHATHEPGSADADRMIRGIVGDSDAARISIGTVDPTEGFNFRHSLRREILSDSVSVLIADLENYHSQTIPTDDQNLVQGGIPAVEYHLQPASHETTLHFEWLLKRGYADSRPLDGVHGPKIAPPKVRNQFAPPLDGWDGFEELRLYRKRSLLTTFDLDSELPEPSSRPATSAYWRVHVAAQHGDDVDRVAVILSNLGTRMGFRIQIIRGRDSAGAFAQLLFSRPRPGQPVDPISPRISVGDADLVLAFGAASLLEALTPDSKHQVATPGQTTIIFDPGIPQNPDTRTHHAAMRPFLATQQAPAPQAAAVALAVELKELGISCEIAPLQQLCARFFYRRDLAAAAIIGFAFQQGLIPATLEVLEKLGRRARKAADSEGQAADSQLVPQAIKLGRRFALDQTASAQSVADESSIFTHPPESTMPQPTHQTLSSSNTVVPHRPPATAIRYQHPEHLIKKYCLAISRRRHPRAKHQAENFRDLAYGTLDAVTRLRHRDPGRAAENELIARIIDCEVWGGPRYAKAYADRVRAVYATEVAGDDFEVTRLVITHLAKAMIWVDPFFLCAYAVRPNRIRRMNRQMRISRASGERLTFRIRTRNQTALLRNFVGPYWKFTPLTAGIIRHARALRYLPGMFRHEKHYRRWVLELIDESIAQMPEKRSLYLEAIGQLERVHGPAPGRWRRASRVRLAVQSLREIAAPPRTLNSQVHQRPEDQ